MFGQKNVGIDAVFGRFLTFLFMSAIWPFFNIELVHFGHGLFGNTALCRPGVFSGLPSLQHLL